MLVVRLNSLVEVSAVPRIAPALSDTLKLTATNETTQIETIIYIEFYMYNGRLVFTFDIPIEFKAGNKYEVEINNENTNTIIYRGKMIVINETTDIQNYTPSTQQTQRFKVKSQ